MVVDNVHRMIGGDGETSYSRNSSVQGKIILKVRPILENAIKTHYSICFPECFQIADLGCSSGKNTFLAVSGIIDTVVGLCRERVRPIPEFHVALNDLPENDFNSISVSLSNFYNEIRREKGVDSCFVSCTPGSFYGRLFPAKALHFVHSSSSLHWLSRVPDGIDNNKGNIYIGRTSPPNVFEAYLRRFQDDFWTFLICRADEMVDGGHMIVTFLGRTTTYPDASREYFLLGELLSQSLFDMAKEGLIKERDIDSYNIPIYTPYRGEVEDIIKKQGSFNLDKLEIMETNWDPDDPENDSPIDKYRRGQRYAQLVRAAYEAMVERHFGREVVEDLFTRFARHLAEADEKKTKSVPLVISLIRKERGGG